MARPEKPVDVGGGVAAAFATELRRLRACAGNPTYREMARSALFAPSVLSNAASGTRLPTLQVTLGFVAACGGDREEWRRRWMEAANVANTDTPSWGRYRSSPSDRGMPRPAQLPLRSWGFVGRRRELDLLDVPAATPVVVTGPVGVGKSDLALHHAHRVAADMVDGQLYADLGPLTGTASDAGFVLDGFLRALGVPADRLPGTVDQRAGLYRSLLVERRLLVLLENVRDERQVRPLLTESRHSQTLVVSRKPLLGLDGVRRVRLDVPSRSDSLAMITAAVPERAEAEPHECDRLAELCDDLPLALNIALRKLVARPDVPLHRANAKLAERDGALSWLRIGDLSLFESLNCAYQEVGEAARALLTRIARLPYRCDPDSVVPEGGELAEELVEAGLLRRGDQPGSYRVERLVRVFAIQVAAGPGNRAYPSPLRLDVPPRQSRRHEPVDWDAFRGRPDRANCPPEVTAGTLSPVRIELPSRFVDRMAPVTEARS
ncbi:MULTISPECIES: XRE family transcriptional regulator [Saccharothrix]|uniref:XRE family transcriptional regulator n=1 Tax=Saccharothrix TaxID=2071 RepID=UPI001161106E|nr:XRE family transcriptional regulator [Saccharothrix sp. CB00851]